MVQKLFVLGSNASGQLGLGHEDDVSSPTLVDLPDALQQDEIVKIASGGNHTLLLTASGALYAAGNNIDGICLLPRQQQFWLKFTKADLVDKIKLCAATWISTILVTEDDRILTIGRGQRGELGLGQGKIRNSSLVRVNLLVPTGERIVSVSASMSHAVVVLSNGDVHAWGNGRQGQCGSAHEGTVWEPTLVGELSFPIESAVCGKDFTALIPKEKSNNMTILRGGKRDRDRFDVKSAPLKVPSATKSTVATWGSILGINESGELVACGRNDRGQLGPSNLSDLVDLKAGTEHAVGLTGNGSVLAWGWGEHGNCGLPVDEQSDVKERPNVLDVPGRVRLLGAGSATTFIVSVAD